MPRAATAGEQAGSGHASRTGRRRPGRYNDAVRAPPVTPERSNLDIPHDLSASPTGALGNKRLQADRATPAPCEAHNPP